MTNIKQLRSFVVLCEELHFGRAAQRLNIVQPALSMHIKSLEEDLGTQLFTRDRSGVTLTATGDVFRSEAIAILERLDSAIERVHQASEGKLGKLHLAGSATALASGVTAPFIRRFSSRFPAVDIKVSEIHPFEQARALANGEIDIAFAARHFDTELHAQFDRHRLTGFRYLLAVSHEHPLAHETNVSITCVARETLISLQTENINGDVQPIYGTLPRQPRHYLFASSPLTMLSLVDANLGVAVISEALCKNAGEGITFLEIDDVSEEMEVWMYSRADDPDPVTGHFISVVNEMAPASG
ncbi:LysR substrate-binding domain-containing protein [Martelella sp. HB161492]|uniref:LysR family transcriptional regulator n=1 Tax=Martelella sp. HB161492 TaxID=2720726 RepID=UPI0015917297|nr:LysR substrate-binding domain-containing protein [Martelella sp. HB161492]